MHPDETAEDSWGRVPLQHVVDRFGAAEWRLDKEEHRLVVGNLKRNSPDQWQRRYEEAQILVRTFRNAEQRQR